MELSRGEQINWYLQGIRRAEQAGLICYAAENTDNKVVSDDYGHICDESGVPLVLKYTNTRPLSLIARQVLNLYRNDPDFQFLELGPGAGVACATVKRLLPGAIINTVSLTPINPYLKFRWDDVYDHLAELHSHNKCASGLFNACSHPFIHNQYIGKFPIKILLPKQDYHFIYENHGAIFHNFQRNGNDERMELARASIASALSLLRRDGMMLIMASDGSYGIEEALELLAMDTDVIVTCRQTTGYHSCPCAVAKKGSPLSTHLREDGGGLLSSSERVLRLETQTLEEIIAKICSSRR